MRISKDEYYLNIAEAVCKRGTCLRRIYGAVIVQDDEIISTGYNGSPRGVENCCDKGECAREKLGIPKGERYELCLTGDTVVKLLDGTYETLEKLSSSKRTNFWVYSVDTLTGKIVPALATFARQTGVASKLCHITLDNGKVVKCTPDHLILMRNCTYKRADELDIEDSIMHMYYNFTRNDGYEAIELTESDNHKVVSVDIVESNEPVYDLEVPEYENFAVDLGDNSCIFVHNCVAVHGEQNAIISAGRKTMIGATMYIAGLEVSNGEYANPEPCLLCRRMIKNAGIENLVLREKDGSIRKIKVSELL